MAPFHWGICNKYMLLESYVTDKLYALKSRCNLMLVRVRIVSAELSNLWLSGRLHSSAKT